MSFKAKKIDTSIIALVLSIGFIVCFRTSSINPTQELSWDVFGYYLPLPATFIYDDPTLNSTEWVEQVNAKYKLTGTLYQVASNEEGKPMYFFLFGMSFFYAPFFFIGHLLAGWLGFPQDGFSAPYNYALAIGMMVYTLIGLLFLRKVLNRFFSPSITALVLLIIVFGTNYSHHLTLKNLEPVNVLFMLCTILLWNTLKWHETKRFTSLLLIGMSVTGMALVKPSEVLISLLPLLWNVTNKQSLYEKIALLREYRKQLLRVCAICLLLASPQYSYWLLKTGKLLYDSYVNPGVGLDFFSPHCLNVLFSFKKGWLLYTPVMLLALLGYVPLRRLNPKLYIALLLTFCVSFYIVSSWTEWWYGAGFSIRPLITYYPLLAICLGYFLYWINSWSWAKKVGIGVFVGAAIFLNQFQWWQLRNYILNPYSTTKAYYFATFLKTSITENDQKLLSFQRSFYGNNAIDPSKITKRRHLLYTSFDTLAHNRLRVSSAEEFAFAKQYPYYELTDKEYCWIEVILRYQWNEKKQAPLFAIMMNRTNGDYGYQTFALSNTGGAWKTDTLFYLTPPIRSTNDELKFFFWNREKATFYIDKIDVLVNEMRQ